MGLQPSNQRTKEKRGGVFKMKVIGVLLPLVLILIFGELLDLKKKRDLFKSKSTNQHHHYFVKGICVSCKKEFLGE